MSCRTFCTCTDLACPKHPKNHDGGCSPCIEKNLSQHEIPACFWNEIGNDEAAKSNYIFMRFAEKVIEAEGGSLK